MYNDRGKPIYVALKGINDKYNRCMNIKDEYIIFMVIFLMNNILCTQLEFHDFEYLLKELHLKKCYTGIITTASDIKVRVYVCTFIHPSQL